MTNTSATGGYILPSDIQKPPGGLTLIQFIQTVLVGLSTLPGNLVRPKWQVNPPKNPDIDVNWIAFGEPIAKADANAYVGINPSNVVSQQRQESLEFSCAFYGPKAFEYTTLVRDGFQIPQNLDALRAANMGFAETLPAFPMPELINERWFNRYEMGIILRRQVQYTYPILSLVSANGVIHTVLGNEEYLLDWSA